MPTHDTTFGAAQAHPFQPSTPAATWDQRFSEHEWPTNPDAALVELVEPLEPGHALDLGCGPGRNAVWLASHGWQVTGVDISPVGLAQAEARAAAAGTTLQVITADLLDYQPPAKQFDLVLVANVHVAPQDRRPLFAAAASALAPGGHLLVIGHHLDSLGRIGPPDPERLYTEAILVDLVPMLEVEQLRRFERPALTGDQPAVDAVLWARAPAASATPAETDAGAVIETATTTTASASPLPITAGIPGGCPPPAPTDGPAPSTTPTARR